jgi:hypothetical protein
MKGQAMRHRTLLAMILMVVPSAAFGQNTDEAGARALAKQILDKGATLFDTRDAEAMSATYVDDGQIILIKRDSNSNKIQIETRRGRAEIKNGYADIFKDRLPEHRSRNTVETARFIGPDLLLITGRFALNQDQGDVIEFVQVRAREGDQWKVVTMQLTTLPK